LAIFHKPPPILKAIFFARLWILSFILLTANSFVQAQSRTEGRPFCGASPLQRVLFEREPLLADRQEALEKHRLASLRSPSGPPDAAAPYLLPIVFHIVHDGGPENLSDAQIQTALVQLNAAFAQAGYFGQGNGASTQISFCLARRTPANTATAGITRTQSPLTEVMVEAEDYLLKNVDRWDPTRYVNVWVVREVCSSVQGCDLAGYAYQPSAHGGLQDGIVVEAHWLTGAPSGLSVLAHEMGHYLGLYHTFEGGCANADCLADGDRVCDTPPDQSTLETPCNAAINTCSTDQQSGLNADLPDMTSNFMDYSAMECYQDFTPGQVQRMHFFIETARQSLLESRGCLLPCPNPPQAAFTASAFSMAVGETASFVSTSVNTSTYSWAANGLPFSGQSASSYTFSTPGLTTVQLIAGSADSVLCAPDTAVVLVEVACPVQAVIVSGATVIAPGATVTFANASTGATEYEWFLDGMSQGSSFTSYTFPDSGVFAIRLVAGNGLCRQEDRVYISVQTTYSDTCEVLSWKKLYGTPGLENLRGLTRLAGGDILSVGTTSVTGLPSDVLMLRTDADGAVVWSKTFGSPARDSAGFVMATADGGYLLLFNSFFWGGGAEFNDPGCAKFDADGNLLWQRHFETPSYDRFYRAIETAAGDFLICGRLGVVDTGSATCVLRLGPDGSLVWCRLFDREGADWASDIQPDPNGGFFGAGGYFTNTNTLPNGLFENAYIFKLEESGALSWTAGIRPGGGLGGYLNRLLPAGNGLFWGFGSATLLPANGGSLLVGWTFLYDPAIAQIFWNRFYDPDNHNIMSIENAVKLPGNGYVCIGNGTLGSFLLNVDDAGEIRWLRPTIDPSFVTTGALLADTFGFWWGETASLTFNEGDFRISRTDELGRAGDCPTSLVHYESAQVVHELSPGLVFEEITPPELQSSAFAVQDLALSEQVLCNPACPEQEICNNGLDDDGDGLFDCLDSECSCKPCAGADVNRWYFGKNAGLDFTTDPPTPLDEGKTNTREGCAVQCDAQGQLLFYADGYYPYNRIHDQLIDAPLNGSPVTTQTIIVPFPGQADLFLIFHPDSYEHGLFVSGLSYSIFNMELGNGGGGIAPSQLNLPLLPGAQTTEKITAALHCNGRDYWVIAKERGTDRFLSWRIDTAGLQPDPIISAGGTAATPYTDFAGSLKFSPDGRLLANVLRDTRAVELFQFNNSTGSLSFLRRIDLPTALGKPYGLEFSPNGRFIYVSVNSRVIQLDLNEPAPKPVVLTEGAPYRPYGALQLAPNGRIYAARQADGWPSLGVIHRPDRPGLASQFQPDGQPLAPGSDPYLSLPHFISTTILPVAVDLLGADTLCGPGQTVVRMLGHQCRIGSVEWTVSGPATLDVQSDTLAVLTAIQGGVVTVVVRADHPCGRATDTLLVRILSDAPPALDLGPDRLLCAAGVLPLTAPPGFARYRWQDGSDQPGFTAPGPGTYWVEAWDWCGEKQIDTVHVGLDPVAPLALGPDRLVCPGGTAVFSRAGLERWVWTPALYLDCDTCAAVTARPGDDQTYIVVGQTAAGCVSQDTIALFLTDTARVQLDTAVCAGTTLMFHGHELLPGSTQTVLATDPSGCDTLFEIQVGVLDTFYTGLDTLICPGTTLHFQGMELPPGASEIFRLASAAGCDSVVQVVVGAHPPAALVLPADTLLLPGLTLSLVPLLVQGEAPFTWQWQPPDGLSCTSCPDPLLTALAPIEYSATLTDANGCRASDSFRLEIDRTCDLYFPNVFRPDGDGRNDHFYLCTSACIRQIRLLEVFTRWGDRVFTRQEFQSCVENDGWDGRFRGRDLPAGVYVWYAELEFTDGHREIRKGDVTVMR
jgi:gliding motility-associated-like protein